MNYLIDAYNYLFSSEFIGSNLESSRYQLIEYIQRVFDTNKDTIRMVFDSHYLNTDEEIRFFGNIKIIYTSHGQTADEYIIQFIETNPNPKKTTLVSSDKALCRRAASLQSKTISVNDFLELCKRTLKKI